ncbi:MAG TPA: NADPH-dependent FMN reductase [Actinomycetaceae bacterium]|nr:NADPH-dependent FMN reductase [Actinomycetaceae bacterium]
MAKYRVGYFIGSLSSTSINRTLSKALLKVAPDDLEFEELEIGNLPLFSQDLEADLPAEVRALKDKIAEKHAVLIITPEYNRSIPGSLKNALDWGSRPYGQNSFDHMPAAVIGASPGNIGTALAQQAVRGVLSFCNARQMTAPEAYITFDPEVYEEDGTVTSDRLRNVLTTFMEEFRLHIERVLTVIPRLEE